MKTILFIIAHEGFQQHEYSVPKKILEDAGIRVVTASDAPGEATGKDGTTKVAVDMTLQKVDPTVVDGIFFIGGPGALPHLDNQESNRILNEVMVLQKPYGAICISPRILAKANVLIGKKATGWNGDDALGEIFRTNNVEYVPKPVVIDGNVITADGPDSAEAFGEAIRKVLGV